MECIRLLKKSYTEQEQMHLPSAYGDIEPINSYNCIYYILHAEKQSLEELKRKSAILKENFEKICSGRSFLLLTEQQLYEFLTRADLRAVTDIRLFHYLTEWYRYDKMNRGYLMSDLMSKFIRIELLEGKPVACEWNMSHRPQVKLGKIVLASLDPDSKKIYFESYNTERDEWLTESWQQRQMESSCSSMLYYNNKFILSGGLNAYNFVEYLDLESLEWYELPPMRESRKFHVMNVVNENLYVIGGVDKNEKVIVSVEKYEFRTRKWKDVAPLPDEFIPESATSLNGLIYVSSKMNPSLYCYDPHTDKWTQITRPALRRSLNDLVALNGYIYTINKFNESRISAIQRYDVAQKMWSDVSPLEESYVICTGTATLMGLLLVCLQEGKKSKLREYDPRTNELTTLCSNYCHRAEWPLYVFATN